jgi:hypothetical protein
MTRGKEPGFSVGMPTSVDVDRIVGVIGVPLVGRLIAYAELEEVLRVTVAQSRFWSVTSAWRKKLERENNLILEAVPTEGFKVLDNHERVGHASRYFKSGMRRTSVAGRRAASTSRVGLASDETRALDHVSRTAAAFKVQAAMEARKLRELPAPLTAEG